MDKPKKMEGSVHRPFSMNINPDYVDRLERENASLQQEVERYKEALKWKNIADDSPKFILIDDSEVRVPGTNKLIPPLYHTEEKYFLRHSDGSFSYGRIEKLGDKIMKGITHYKLPGYPSDFDGPDVEDGHDCEGFPGGCERFGCPGGDECTALTQAQEGEG